MAEAGTAQIFRKCTEESSCRWSWVGWLKIYHREWIRLSATMKQSIHWMSSPYKSGHTHLLRELDIKRSNFLQGNATGWLSGQSWKLLRCTNVSNVQMFLKESCKHSIAASCATSTVPRALRLALARIKFDHRHNKKTKELLQVLK